MLAAIMSWTNSESGLWIFYERRRKMVNKAETKKFEFFVECMLVTQSNS